MNLHFKNIKQWGDITRKLKRISSPYYNFYLQSEDPEGLRVQKFTLEKTSAEDSKENLQNLLQFCEKNKIPYLIARGSSLQFLGHTDYIDPDYFWHDDFLTELNGMFRSSYMVPKWQNFESEDGYHVQDFTGYGENIWLRSPDIGFYDVESKEKIKDRKKQISIIWDKGFVSRRGRPVTAANEYFCGSKEDIITLTHFAKELAPRRWCSDVSKKVLSVYNSTKRYYCWPGTW